MDVLPNKNGSHGQRFPDRESFGRGQTHGHPKCRLSEAIGFPDRKDWYALAILAAAVVLMFWKVLFTSQMLFYRDILNQSYPLARLIHEICRKGSLPYWNPYLNFGQPILENPNSLFFYPTTLLIVLLPVDLAYTLHFVLHFVLAAIGTYWLARRWRISHLAALFAAILFVFSGPALSLGSFYNEVACAAWIPWALLSTDYAVASCSIRSWILLAMVFLMQFLAGEPFTLLATFGLCFAYALFLAGFFQTPLAKSTLRVLAAFIMTGGAVVVLASIQLFPAMALLRRSLRGAIGFPFSQNTYWSLHPLQLIGTIVAGFPDPMFASSSLWTPVLNFDNKPYFPSLFLGFVPVFFAFIGCVMARDRRRRFVGWSALALLLLAFGRFTPLYRLALFALPILKLVRFPIKLMIPVILLTALLAGWGIDVVRKADASRFKKANGVLASLLVMTAGVWLLWGASWLLPRTLELAAAWMLRRTIAGMGIAPTGAFGPKAVQSAAHYFLNMLHWQAPGVAGMTLGAALWFVGLKKGDRRARMALPAALLLGAAQLVLVNYSANPTVSRSLYDYRPPVLDHFKPSRMPYRYADVFGGPPLAAVATQALEQPLDFQSIPGARYLSVPASAALQERLLLEHGGMLENAEGISNVDPDWSFPVPLYRFWVFALHKTHDPDRTVCLMGRGNVRYQIIGGLRNYQTLSLVAAVSDGTPFSSYLYRNRCFLPRAYVAGSAVYSPDPGEMLARLSDPDFNARGTVLLASKTGSNIYSLAPTPAGQVESFVRHPNSVTLQVKLSRPGYVVLLDRFDPNWHATVDGHEVRIQRANYLFRAVPAGVGEHTIHFYYRQRWLAAGVAVSLCALALCAVLFFLDLPVSAVERPAWEEVYHEPSWGTQDGGSAEAVATLPGVRQ
jgi:Bacterial membrane protein YfhO